MDTRNQQRDIFTEGISTPDGEGGDEEDDDISPLDRSDNNNHGVGSVLHESDTSQCIVADCIETKITQPNNGIVITFCSNKGIEEQRRIFMRGTVSAIVAQLQKETGVNDIAVQHRDKVRYGDDCAIEDIKNEHDAFLLDIGSIKHIVRVCEEKTHVTANILDSRAGVPSRRPVEETAAAVDEVLETRHPPTPTTTHPDNDVRSSRRFSVPEGEKFLEYMEIEKNALHIETPGLDYKPSPTILTELYNQMKSSSASYVEDEDGAQFYNMYGYKGRALIVNVCDYKKKSTRWQSSKDIRNLRPLFMRLGFQVEDVQLSYSSKKDRKHIMDVLDTEISNPVYENKTKKYRMFILVIMTHGDYGVVCNPDSSIENLTDIYKKLSPDQFRAMAGKPKFVIVQSCSGTDDAKVHNVPDRDLSKDRPAGSGPLPPRPNLPSASGDAPDVTSVAEQPSEITSTTQRIDGDDICIWQASFPGYGSWKDDGGSWLIRAVTETFYKHAHHAHLGELFEHVQVKIREYSIKYDEKKRNELPSKNQNRIQRSRLQAVLSRLKRGSRSERTPKERDMYAQQPCQMNFFVRKRKLYLFPNLEEYTINDDDECTIVDTL